MHEFLLGSWILRMVWTVVAHVHSYSLAVHTGNGVDSGGAHWESCGRSCVYTRIAEQVHTGNGVDSAGVCPLIAEQCTLGMAWTVLVPAGNGVDSGGSSATPGEVILNSIDGRRKKACVHYFKHLKPEKCKGLCEQQSLGGRWKIGGLRKTDFSLV